MLEYIFFDERPWTSFVEFLENLNLTPKSTISEESWLVALPEDIDDDLFDRIEVIYDEMLDFNEELVASAEGDTHVYAAGVNITLSDGRIVQAAIDPELMKRLLQVVTPEELGGFVNQVVDAVEYPTESIICQR